MARKLAHEDGTGRNRESDSKPTTDGRKALLNRRKYLALGASAVAVALGTGTDLTGTASAQSDTFQTDFSEYAP